MHYHLNDLILPVTKPPIPEITAWANQRNIGANRMAGLAVRLSISQL